MSFVTFKEASEENPLAVDALTATAKLQDTLAGGNLIGGANGKSLQEGSDALMDAIVQQAEESGKTVDLDNKASLKNGLLKQLSRVVRI